MACANIDVLVAGAPKRRFLCRHAAHTVGVRNSGILEFRCCTRPVSVMTTLALPDTEQNSGRVQHINDRAKRHVDVSTVINMYKLHIHILFQRAFGVRCTPCTKSQHPKWSSQLTPQNHQLPARRPLKPFAFRSKED